MIAYEGLLTALRETPRNVNWRRLDRAEEYFTGTTKTLQTIVNRAIVQISSKLIERLRILGVLKELVNYLKTARKMVCLIYLPKVRDRLNTLDFRRYDTYIENGG